MTARSLVLACCLLGLFSAGCADRGPALVPLRGQVVYQGGPIAGARLVFHPQFGGEGWMPVAESAADGSFSASTRVTGDGVVPGRYKVSVTWHPLATSDDDGPNHLPERYAAVQTTPLEVQAGSKRDEVFLLEILE